MTAILTFVAAYWWALAVACALLYALWRRGALRWAPAAHVMPAGDDHLSGWEKAALTTSMAGAVFNIFVWYIGSGEADLGSGALYWLRVLFGAVTAASFDLVCVVTTMGRRQGRRSAWSWLTALAAAAASALIALDVAAQWYWPGLHAANPIIVFLFMQHLAAPRINAQPVVDAAQHEAQFAQLQADLAQAGHDLAQARGQTTQQAADAAQRRAEMEQAVRGAQQHARDLAQTLREKEQEIAQLKEQAAQPIAVGGVDRLAIARTLMDRGVSQREAARLVGMADATLRNRLKAQTNGHAVEA